VTAKLVKIHVHTRSEHHVDGEELDGEIHLVHRIVEPTAGSTGSTLIVLGVFFAADTDPRTCVPHELCEAWAGSRGADAGAEVKITPGLLLPDQSRWYRYEGSLTTPAYDEIVSWLVFATPLGIASDDLERLRSGAAQRDHKLQALGRRFVLRNFE